ncbi:MAG: hypothetical protein P8Y02_14040 [Deinococcales bacterium]
MLGSAIAALGFFFLPIVSLKPNRLAAGVPFNLLQLQGDYRYILLFALALVPFMVAFRKDVGMRGWLLVILGNLLLLLTLVLPAMAGQHLLANAKQFLGENAFVRNPRVLPTGGLAMGLAGGYMTLFAGLRDLKRAGIQGWVRSIAAWGGVVFIFINAQQIFLRVDARVQVYQYARYAFDQMGNCSAESPPVDAMTLPEPTALAPRLSKTLDKPRPGTTTTVPMRVETSGRAAGLCALLRMNSWYCSCMFSMVTRLREPCWAP